MAKAMKAPPLPVEMAHGSVNTAVLMSAIGRLSSAANAPLIHSGAQLALVLAFDKKIERDAYIELSERISTLHDQLARLTTAIYLAEAVKAGRDPVKVLEDFVSAMIERSEKVRGEIVKTMELVVQCPDERDTRH